MTVNDVVLPDYSEQIVLDSIRKAQSGLKAQEDAKAKASQIETDLWKIELDINKHHRTTMMSNPNNYVNAEGVTLKAAYPDLFAGGYFNPDNMKTFQQVRGMNAIFELFSPIPEADEKTIKGHTELLKNIANRSDSEAKYRKILEEGPDKHSVPIFWKNYSQTDEWKKLLADAGGSEEGYLKAFQIYNSFKKVKDENLSVYVFLEDYSPFKIDSLDNTLTDRVDINIKK